MKLQIANKDRALLLVASLALAAIAVIGWSLAGEPALIVLQLLASLLLLVVLLVMYARLSEEMREIQRVHEYRRKQDYRQIESLFSLFFALKPDLPLPTARGWAASPDLLRKITEVILTEKPRLVVEASSGVSTLIIAYCLRRLGAGKVVSLEHDAEYASSNRSLISSHGLEDIATIVHAPLKEFDLNDGQWLWYDSDRLNIDQPIDLLVVDGPPGDIQKLSRYPAVPLLYSRLNSRATIILDDGHRPDEKEIVARWEEEFSHVSSEFLDTEKGTYVIRKNERGAGG